MSKQIKKTQSTFLPPASVAAEAEVLSYGINRLSSTMQLFVAFTLTALTVIVIVGISVIFVWSNDGYWATHISTIILMVGVVIAFALSVIIGFTTVRGTLKSLRHITDTVGEIKTGNYDARTGFTGYDDIGRMGRMLDEMANALKNARNYEQQLTVDLVHELRTPLMAMRATLEAMIDGVIPADEEHMAVVHTNIVRLSRLVNLHLELSRLENRIVPFTVQEVNLRQLANELVTSFEMLAEDSGLSLSRADIQHLYVRGDADLLRQALSNLLSNAIRYTPEGGEIKIAVKKSGSDAEILVEDTGIGIAEEDLEFVCLKLWRASNNRSKEDGGFGIGLALVKEIVELHDGEINVSSTLGVGSRFSLRIPLSQVSEEAKGKRMRK